MITNKNEALNIKINETNRTLLWLSVFVMTITLGVLNVNTYINQFDAIEKLVRLDKTDFFVSCIVLMLIYIIAIYLIRYITKFDDRLGALVLIPISLLSANTFMLITYHPISRNFTVNQFALPIIIFAIILLVISFLNKKSFDRGYQHSSSYRAITYFTIITLFPISLPIKSTHFLRDRKEDRIARKTAEYMNNTQ